MPPRVSKMAQFGRKKMSIATGLRAIAFVGLVVSPFAQCQTATVEVRNLDEPGAVVIENHGPSIALARKVLVERKQGTEWIESPVFFNLVEHCGTAKAPACPELASGATLKPVRWNGYTCSGQCPRSCRSNHYAGPGVFRFVVFSCDRSQRFVSQEFALPAQKPH